MFREGVYLLMQLFIRFFLIVIHIAVSFEDPKECTWPKCLTPEEGEAKRAKMVKEVAAQNPEYFSIKIDDALHIRIATKLNIDFVTSVAKHKSHRSHNLFRQEGDAGNN